MGVVRLNFLERYESKQIVGNDKSVYFIEDQKVYKFNFWKGEKLHLPLPEELDPEAVIVNPKKEKEFSPGVFSYGDNLINLIGTTTGSFFNNYHFYIRDTNEWNKKKAYRTLIITQNLPILGIMPGHSGLH